MEELLGCWREAQRADKVAGHLVRIRNSVGLEFYDHITVTLREVESTSRLLRDLYDLFPIYRTRVAIILYYLNVVLPSLCKTLQEMTIYIDNAGLPPKAQWTLMVERLGAPQAGMTLPQRLAMYVELLIQLIRLLSKSPLYDPTSLELLSMRHLRLRHIQGIPAPPQSLQPARPPPPEPPHSLERRHWAEKIFDDPPHSATGLRHRRESKCFGPPMVDHRLGITHGSTVLFKLPFDKNRISVTLYLQPEGPDMTRLLCRWMDRYFNPLHSCYGVHELCIRRKGSSLQFRRWSVNRMHPTLWMALFFKTWEKMVLFHSAFGALKSRSPLTINITQDDVVLAGEKRLFQGKILDDGYEHILTVLQDEKCHGLRLHAAVRNGELRRCPVWTAFITHQSASPSWLKRHSRHRIWLRDVFPYVFCQKYKKKHQVTKNGAFEIYFVNEEAADAFEDTFREGSEIDSLDAYGGSP